jgi:hypothetical protein
MWQDLAYLDDKTKKIEKEEEKFIPKEKPKEVKKQEVEEKIDPNFDDDSLTVYGALLSESLEKAPEG